MCVQFGPATKRTCLFVPGLLLAVLPFAAPVEAQRLTTSFIGHGSPGGDPAIRRRVVIGGDRVIRREPVIGGDVALRRKTVIGGDTVLGPRTDFDTGLNIRFALQPARNGTGR